MFDLSSGPKKAVALSALLALIVALATIADTIWAYPFNGMIGFDSLFLLNAVIVIYLAYDAFQDLVPERRRNRRRSSVTPATSVDRRPENESIGSVGRAGPKNIAKPSRHKFAGSVTGSSRF